MNGWVNIVKVNVLLLYTLRDVLTFNWKHIVENKSRLANLKLAYMIC